MKIAKAALLLAASSSAIWVANARAQDGQPTSAADQPQLEGSDKDIIVTGTRSALENAERTKRDSAVLIDGISADDIGALPDESIADSLVRIPGLTANDKEDGFDQVSVRGLGPDLTNTTYNGRILPTISANDRRSNLGTLPTEGLAAANVQKTAQGSTIEGGLGGTVNLLSIHPLETRRRGFTAVGRVLFDDIAGKVKGVYGFRGTGYRGEASYVGKITDRLGVSVSYAYISQSNVSPSTQLDTYQTSTGARADRDGDGRTDAYANNAGVTVGAGRQERHSVLGMVQWDPTSSLRISADGYWIKQNNSGSAIRYFANGAAAAASGVPTATVVTNGVVTQFQGNVGLYRQIVNGGTDESIQTQGGLNFAFDNGGPIKANFDISYARAKVTGASQQATIENDSINAAQNAAGQLIAFGYDARDPNNVAFNFTKLAPEDYALSNITFGNPSRSDTIKSARLDFTAPLTTSFLRSLDFGMRVDNRRKINRPDGTTIGYGTLANRPDLDSTYLAATVNPLVNIAQYIGGESAGNFPLFDIAKLLPLQSAPGAVVNLQQGNDIAGRADVGETTFAVYGQANIKAGGLTGNLGLRYFITDVDVRGFSGTTETNLTPLNVKQSYDYLLPALNLRYEITKPLIARFALSKTLSRPVFGALRIGSALDLNTIGDNPTINRGNPNLQPFQSKNADLSLEWYPNRATSVAIQGFYKQVTNFVTNINLPGTILLPNGTTVPATINTSVNDPTKRNFYGIEIVARRDFDFLPGALRYFGVRLDYTHNWTSAFDLFNTVDAASGNRARLTPNNFTPNLGNAQLYYSRREFDIRLAYRYYDQYSRLVDNAYQTKPSGLLDLSGSVTIWRGFRVIGTIRNITKSRTLERFVDYRYPDSEALYRSNVYDGRTVTVGTRLQF